MRTVSPLLSGEAPHRNPTTSALPDLLLLPGMMCDAAVWTHQIAALSDLAVCHVPSYGAARTFTEMAETVLRQAPLHFAVAGHSMGARVALEVERLAPARVDALCLLAAEPHPQPTGERGAHELEGRLALLATARERGMRGMGEAWLPSIVAPQRLQDQTLVTALLAMFERQTPQALEAQILAGTLRPDSTAQLTRIGCPVQLIAGARDAMRPPAVAEEMARSIPSCRLAMLPECGHMMTLEQPTSVSAVMRQWLAEAAAHRDHA
jgi:pimeloyl-ACP methyl ester carboxylesterase